MREDRGMVMRRSAGALRLLAIGFLCGIGRQARAQETPDLMAMAAGIESRLASSNVCYESLDRVINDFQVWQHFWAMLAVPCTNAVVYAKRGELHAFDPTGFPPGFLAALVPETYRDAVDVYRVSVAEDPVSRDRVIYNSDGLEIWRLPAPEGYDPLARMRIIYPWVFEEDTSWALEWRARLDPSRIRCEYLLMPLENLPTYAAALAERIYQRSLTLPANRFTMLVNTYAPASDAFVFTDIVVTNDIVDLELHLPDGTNCCVDLFWKESLLDPWWSLAMTTPTETGTFRMQIACSLSNAFFRAGNADIDSDGDGIPDDRELLMYGTNPLLSDSDGDGLSDFDELFVCHTNPLLRDTDGDGMDDDEEARAGTDPNAANTGAGASSIRYYYDADDRLTGAYGGSGSGGGAGTYANTPSGNTSTAAERSTP